MLISLAAVPKTGGGKYANLGRILMLCITGFNYHKIFSVPLSGSYSLSLLAAAFPSKLVCYLMGNAKFIVLKH